MSSWPIVRNCNFESRDDDDGRAIHAARKALDAGLVHDNEALAEAMDELESVLEEHAESESCLSVEACERAEAKVVAAWTDEIQAAARAEQRRRWDRG